MPADGGVRNVLEALPEPALVVSVDGRVALANRAALARLALAGPADGLSPDLGALSPGPEAAAALLAYLRRCSGSRSTLPGTAELRGTDGRAARFRCHGCLLEPARGDAPARVLLRLSAADDERFSVLAQKVTDLNAEVRRRRRAQAELEEAVRERDLLLRELHHRVKNNIHMLVGMLSAARREAAGLDASAVLGDAAARLTAIGAVHQLLYVGDNLRGVRADEFVVRIGTMAAEALGQGGRVSFDADAVEIPNDAAVPLALILNELMTNALKHGARPDGTPGPVRVGLTAAVDGAVELAVEDEGPGFDPAVGATRRASGLGLVRGLARQIGASFSVGVGPGGGARCLVRFRVPQAARATATTGDHLP
jgi:two-component sensor histidine kinase